MKKTFLVSLSSAAAFIALSNVADAQEQTSISNVNASQNVAAVETDSASQYIVKSGDTLYQIALDHDITLDELYKLNPGVTPLIFPGDIIVVSPTGLANQVQNTSYSSNQFEAEEPIPSASTQYNNVPQVSAPQVQYTAEPSYEGSNGLHSISNSGNLYAFGNCTYYAFNRRAELGKPIGSLWGNAADWATSARNAGFTVNNTPVAGAVFQSNPGTNGAGGYGHVGVVEKVNSNGTLTVSEMNWNGGFNVKSYRTITNPGSYNYIH
ncbi:CHAP domain-containing protein [Staphylococcus pasteuri]|uniref:COG3942 and LysM peptidoglycan-binding domain-containing protein n=1 Tax=Staphylococcus TaxID=1279 RepID=UPI00048BCEE8|nr:MULTISPECIES: CHAP domain-containing protein [Staphylococcus]MBL3398358.1 CHAP domain-containing protein [Staphylococcus pasteuri]MCD9066048.1 CHAP domain-containing protein [Staphylococcus pasteuri]RNM18836.1 CHAP domain-containing protein [Staphylococcus pasteuri]WAE41354.1 CHAP domain-containing protein [Staphylococcus pasteuri]